MTSYSPVDYLVIGHLTKDITPTGWKLGGTAAYSALTAKALGYSVGIVTVGNFDPVPLELSGIQVAMAKDKHSSTFENIQTPSGRVQFLHQKAKMITAQIIPEQWLSAPIIHLGPIMQEVSISILENLYPQLTCLTPQGWLRTTDENHKVIPGNWKEDKEAFQKADIVILSNEDVGFDEKVISLFQSMANILVVTEGFAGSRVYYRGEYQYFHAQEQTQQDPTGAGDIYAACFFSQYHKTKNPWQAAEFATQMASISVTRIGLEAVPNDVEIKNYDIKIGKAL